MSELRALLEQIRRGIADDAYPNESAVGHQIVVPVLRTLGWNVESPSFVRHEFLLRLKDTTRRVDLALCVSGDNPRCIIELKATGKALNAARGPSAEHQVFEYAFFAGAQLAVLTNGAEWRLYSAQSFGRIEERLVWAVNVSNDSPDVVASGFERYLSFANVASGDAADFARRDLRVRRDQQEARQSIPDAWDQLCHGDASDVLVDLVREATSALAQGEPRREDVVAFLHGLTQRPARRKVRKPKPEPGAPREPRPECEERRLGGGSGSVRYSLLGEERRAKNFTDAYVDAFRAFAGRDPSFVDRADPRLRGRKNRVVARTKEELAENSQMRSTARELPGGWWLLTKMSSKQKQRVLRTACGTAGIPFDDPAGLKIGDPSA